MRPRLLLLAIVGCATFGCATGPATTRSRSAEVSQTIRSNGVVLRVPADLRPDTTSDPRAAFHPRTERWRGARVAVSVSVCTVAHGPDSCTLGDRLPGIERAARSEPAYSVRMFERVNDGRPSWLAWITSGSPDTRVVAIASGSAPADSALAREVIQSIRVAP